MASPHVAGAAALYLQAHPRTRARDVARRPPEQRRPGAVADRGAGRARARRPPGRRAASTSTTRSSPRRTIAPGQALARRRRLPPASHASSRSPTGAPERGDVRALDRRTRRPLAGRDVFREHVEPAPSAVAFTRAGRADRVDHRAGARGRARVDVRITPDAGAFGGRRLRRLSRLRARRRRPAAARPVRRLQGRLPGRAGDDADEPGLPVAGAADRRDDRRARPPSTRSTPSRTPARRFTLAPVTFGPASAAPTSRSCSCTWTTSRRRIRRRRPQRPAAGAASGEAFSRTTSRATPSRTSLAQPWALVDAAAVRRHGSPRRPAALRLPDGEYALGLTVERALAGRRTPVETWTSPPFRIDRST